MLAPGNADGKDRVFIDLLGYRPQNAEDAEALAETYVAQAQARLAKGAYRLGHESAFGRRYTIEIALRGTTLLSGWLLRPDGTFSLPIPFVGFPRRPRFG